MQLRSAHVGGFASRSECSSSRGAAFWRGCWAQQAATVETSEKEVKSMKSLEEAGRLIATTQPATSAIRDDRTRSPTCEFFVRRTEPGVRQASRSSRLRMPPE